MESWKFKKRNNKIPKLYRDINLNAVGFEDGQEFVVVGLFLLLKSNEIQQYYVEI